MDLNESNVNKSLSEIAPYIEADGGFVEFVEIEEETKFVKVRLGGACTSCAMSAMTLKQGIQNKIFQDEQNRKDVVDEELKTDDTDVTWGQLARTMGFAQSPALLVAFGVFSSRLFLILSVIITFWLIATMVMAVRQSLDFKMN